MLPPPFFFFFFFFFWLARAFSRCARAGKSFLPLVVGFEWQSDFLGQLSAVAPNSMEDCREPFAPQWIELQLVQKLRALALLDSMEPFFFHSQTIY